MNGVSMDLQDSIRDFSQLEREQQARLLAIFGHNLTIAARDTYEFQSPRVASPERLRKINEVQHRVFGHIIALIDDGHRYPDDVLLSILLEHDDSRLREQMYRAFGDALRKSVA